MTRSTDVLRDTIHLPTEESSSMVFVRTLGAASIDAGATHLTPTSVRKFALLFYLWAERGRSVTRGTLHDLVFPEQTATNARHSIRELIYQFRKLGARIASDGETVELASESVRADYSDALRQERPSLDQLRSAAGGFMPGYAPMHSEAFTEWLEAFRGRATSELNRVFVAELNRARKLGDWTLADAAARAVLALDPLHEEATFATAELLAIGGAKALAVKLLDRYAEEVGVTSPALKLPAAVLRRRISERSREIYRAPLTLPFLGRDAEMAALQERFERAKAGEAQCAVLVGEAGIGKTRLAEELCTQAVLAGASVERVATQPHDVHRPMATFADLVPKLLELPGALGCSPESMAALRRLTVHDPGEASSGEANSELVAASISRAIADLVDSIASEAPLLILIDDAQWTDERSRETLSALAAARHPRRLIIVVTSRDRAINQYFAQRSERLVGVSLAPLTNRSSTELTSRVLLEHAGADSELQQWIASTSGGNPFFLRCLLDHYRATGERFVVPTSLSDLLDQRIAALSSNATAVLSSCVALGRHSDVERLLAALEMRQIDLQLAVAELETAHLVVQVEQRIDAAHSLIAETLSRLTPPVALRLVHRRVASVLQAETQDSGSTALLWDCAEHWVLAGERARAADFLRRCSARALEIGRPREAAELLLRAAGMAGHDLAISLAREATEIADHAHEGDVVQRGIALLRELGVQIESDVLELAELSALVSDWDDPEYVAGRLNAWLVSAAPRALRVSAATHMVIMAEVDGRPEMANQVYDGLISTLPDAADCDDCPTLTLLLIYHCAFGDLEQVQAIVSRLLAKVTTVPAVVAVDIYRKCGVALWRLGKPHEAFQAFAQCYSDAKKLGLHKVQFDAASIIMGLQMDIGGDDTTWLQTIDSLCSEFGGLTSRPSNIFVRLDCACLTGDLSEARKWLEAGRRLYEGSRLLRIQRWIRAAELRVRHLEGDVPTVGEALRLVEHHKPHTEVGDISDLEMAVAVCVLRERDDVELAQALLATYLEVNRRSRAPVARLLREVTAAIQYDHHPAGTNRLAMPA